MPKSSQSAEGTPGIQTLGTDARAENCPRVSPPPCPSSSVVLWLAELLPTQSSLHPMGSTTPFTGGGLPGQAPNPTLKALGGRAGERRAGPQGSHSKPGPASELSQPATLLRGIPSSDCPCAFRGGGAPASQTPPGVSEPQTPPPCPPHPECRGSWPWRPVSFHLQTSREAALRQHPGPPCAPGPRASLKARARGIPGAAQASPGRAIRALEPEGSGKEGGLSGQATPSPGGTAPTAGTHRGLDRPWRVATWAPPRGGSSVPSL